MIVCKLTPSSFYEAMQFIPRFARKHFSEMMSSRAIDVLVVRDSMDLISGLVLHTKQNVHAVVGDLYSVQHIFLTIIERYGYLGCVALHPSQEALCDYLRDQGRKAWRWERAKDHLIEQVLFDNGQQGKVSFAGGELSQS